VDHEGKMRVDDIVRRNACFFGDAIATVEAGSGRSFTWEELDSRANRYARMMGELRVPKGERVVIYSPNRTEFVDFFFGCGRSGTVGAPVNVRLSHQELAGYVRHLEPRAALVDAGLEWEWLAEIPSIRHVIGVGEGHQCPLDLEQLLAAHEPSDPGVAVDPDDPYQLAATSGTTGPAKAAVKTHRSALAAMMNWLAELSIGEGQTYLQSIPMFFNPGGPAGLHPVLMKGGRTVVPRAFEPGQWIEAVEEYAVTDGVLVPTMAQMILSHPTCSRAKLDTLQSVVIGGSPLPESMLAEGREAFGDVFYPFYGMAESYSCGCVLRRESQDGGEAGAKRPRLASCGKPMALVELRVVDDDGREVPHDGETAGEIQMAGDSVSTEYFGMPGESEAVRDGRWLRSGDIGVIDPDGFVTIVDRGKDIIITGGINVYSREIEVALQEHPDVALAAAIGVPHEQWGEAIHAVVVLRDDGRADESELIEFAAARLAAFKKPRSLEIVDQLPLNATGKVLKRELRARYRDVSALS
jgi:acyl-CoA synthetase (AMP-forming)/AMP-acid ligase II